MEPFWRYFAQDVAQEVLSAQHELFLYQNRVSELLYVCKELIANGLNSEKLQAAIRKVEARVENTPKS